MSTTLVNFIFVLLKEILFMVHITIWLEVINIKKVIKRRQKQNGIEDQSNLEELEKIQI